MDTLAFVLAAMNVVAPDVDHTELGTAIAHVVDAQPFAKDDASRRQVAALIVAVAFREGSLRTHVEGDHDKHGNPHSFCTMQINDRSGGTPALNEDLELCVSTGLQMLRTSMRICPTHPIAFYAEGPRGCTSQRAQRISADRVALAKWIAARAMRVLVSESTPDGAKTGTTVPRDLTPETFRHERRLYADLGTEQTPHLHRRRASAGMMSVGSPNLCTRRSAGERKNCGRTDALTMTRVAPHPSAAVRIDWIVSPNLA